MAENLASFPSLGSGPSSFGSDGNLSLDQDPEFVDDADRNRFTCPVHKGILQDIRQTPCGHRICEKCVGIHLNGAPSKICPVGDSDCEAITATNVYPDRSIQREMKNALVFCKNKSDGCRHKIKLRDLASHLDDCEYELASCQYSARGCSEKLLRGQLKSHKEKCLFRPVCCPLCQEEVSFNQLENHDEACPEKTIGCPFGCENKDLKRKEIEEHRGTCPIRPVGCKFQHMGCTFINTKELVERHETENLAEHLELITRHVADLQLTCMDAQSKIQTLTQERGELQQKMQQISQPPNVVTQGQLHQMEGILKDFRIKLVSMMEKLIIVERKHSEFAERPRLEAVEQTITGIQQRINQLEQAREREQHQQRGSGGGGDSGATIARLDTFSTQLTAHDRQLGVHDVRMAEMDLRFQLLETASYDGTLVWKIRDYERRKRDAMNGRTLSLYSQPFYSNRFGYKMCARVYLNGDGMGKTTHLSLFFVVMRGEYDALLNWPFRQKVNLTLLDQSPEKRHLTDHFQPDPTSSSFQKPTSEMNVASGCPLFVSHAVLENPSNGYLRDDTIFIRIVVESQPNPSVF